jgi:hypothetical protein
MDKSCIIIKGLLDNININQGKAIEEIKNHTLYFLKKYECDNLLELIQYASKKGYDSIEWIDFWGVGGMHLDIIITWAYTVIKKQKMELIIEPYYNNINHRLGISIKRCHIMDKFKKSHNNNISPIVTLSMELQKTKTIKIDHKSEKLNEKLNEKYQVGSIINNRYFDKLIKYDTLS